MYCKKLAKIVHQIAVLYTVKQLKSKTCNIQEAKTDVEKFEIGKLFCRALVDYKLGKMETFQHFSDFVETEIINELRNVNFFIWQLNL